jgi:hypothetical protein
MNSKKCVRKNIPVNIWIFSIWKESVNSYFVGSIDDVMTAYIRSGFRRFIRDANADATINPSRHGAIVAT